MKINKETIRKIIVEQLKHISDSSDIEFYLLYDDAGRMFPPKIFTSKEEVENFMENTDYDTRDIIVIPMDYDSILSIKRAK